MKKCFILEHKYNIPLAYYVKNIGGYGLLTEDKWKAKEFYDIEDAKQELKYLINSDDYTIKEF